MGLAVEHRRGVRNALEATGRRLGARTGFAAVRGGLCGGASPACGVLGARASYRPSYLAQTKQEAGQRLTKGLDRRASPAQGLDGGLWRRGGAVLADWSLRWSSGSLDPRFRLVKLLRGFWRDQGASKSPAARKSRRQVDLPAAALRGNPGRCR